MEILSCFDRNFEDVKFCLFLPVPLTGICGFCRDETSMLVLLLLGWS